MIRYYFKIAFRSIIKQQGYGLINISGLSIGIACCLLILLWVQDEISFDQFHENGDDTYMVCAWTRYGSRMDLTSNTPPGLAPALVEEYPDIIHATRLNRASGLVLSYGEKAFVETCTAVDQDFLEMFDYPLVRGDIAAALQQPYSILVTEKMAAKYFVEENPLGKTIEIDGKHRFTVTGVLKDVPQNSSRRFNFLIPFVALADLWNDPGYPHTWTNWNQFTFIQLSPGMPYDEVEAKIVGRVNESYPEAESTLFLARYTDLHLFGFGPVPGQVVLVIIFAIIGLCILLIACLNFMNLTTARSAGRAREIGLRKVAGAQRKDIIVQFYGEALLMTIFSLFLSLVLVELFLPIFNNLAGKSLSFDLTGDPRMIFGLLGVAVLTALVSGSYPALYMASFQPVKIFSGLLSSGPKKSKFRSSFVVWQFTVTIILVIAALTIDKQIEYVLQRDLGIDKDNLVYIPLKKELKSNHEAVKQELLQHPDILHATALARLPTGVWTNGSNWQWEGRPESVNPLVSYFGADTDFLETFGAQVVQGQYFAKDRPDATTVTSGEVLINETFARLIGEEDPVGMRLNNYGTDYTVIGVIKNFHFKAMYYGIGPLMIYQKAFSEKNPNRYQYLVAKTRPGSTESAVEHIRQVCDKFSPGFPLTVRFLEEDYDLMYSGQQKFGDIIRYSAGLMILIAGLGLFGLSAFTAEQRTREIGIRKVLGASVLGILRLLGRQMLIPVLIANVIAAAVSYLLVSGYLMTSFAYRTIVGWEPIVTAALLTIGVALVSVSYQAIKAARANPVDAIRYE